MHMLLDHISLTLRPCGRRKWPGDEAKTMHFRVHSYCTLPTTLSSLLYIVDNVELTSNLNQTRQFTCPGDLVTFTCRVLQSRSLEWRSPLITQTTLFLGDAAPQSQAMLPRGPFTASLTERSGTFVNSNFTSTLQVTASRMFMRNETTVMCLSSTMESETDNFTVAGV